MPYLVDSDLVILHLGDIPDVAELLDQLTSDGLAVSVISYMEAVEGLRRSADPAAAQANRKQFFEGIVQRGAGLPSAMLQGCECCFDVAVVGFP